jgi:hypothetical protein
MVVNHLLSLLAPLVGVSIPPPIALFASSFCPRMGGMILAGSFLSFLSSLCKKDDLYSDKTNSFAISFLFLFPLKGHGGGFSGVFAEIGSS